MPFSVDNPPDAAVMREGEPFYALTRYTLDDDAAGPGGPFSFDCRAFRELPLADAVGLLNGDDETGLIVWAGALALAEWLVRDPSRLQQLLAGAVGGRVGVVELGCGSGVLAVALCKLLGQRAGAAAVELVATDGNTECVALTARNLREQTESAGGGGAVVARAAHLAWGCAAGCASVLEMGSAARLLVVSADVIYDMAAVPLLLATVGDLARAFTAAHATDPAPPPPPEWWLVYTPRSLTTASNEAIYAALTAALAARPTWVVEQIPLPQGSFASGYTADQGNYALLGCIFVVRLGEAAATG